MEGNGEKEGDDVISELHNDDFLKLKMKITRRMFSYFAEPAPLKESSDFENGRDSTVGQKI